MAVNAASVRADNGSDGADEAEQFLLRQHICVHRRGYLNGVWDASAAGPVGGRAATTPG